MQKALISANEQVRLEAVNQLGILDTPPEERFDRITKQATEKLHCPISTITIIDKDREWYKSCQGINVRQMPREISFCAHAMMSSDIFIIQDTLLDSRFKDNPMVLNDPFVRFYAGIALNNKEKLRVGVFCVKDIKPRAFSVKEIGIFMELAAQAETEINKKV